MEITGIVVAKQAIESGTAKSSGKEWKKQNFVIEEIDSQYPKKIAFETFNKMVDISNKLGKGAKVTVHFNLESREWNNRWFTTAKCWKIEIGGVASTPPPAAPLADANGDLPF